MDRDLSAWLLEQHDAAHRDGAAAAAAPAGPAGPADRQPAQLPVLDPQRSATDGDPSLPARLEAGWWQGQRRAGMPLQRATSLLSSALGSGLREDSPEGALDPKEAARAHQRTVFTHARWRRHRSARRYFRHVLGVGAARHDPNAAFDLPSKARARRRGCMRAACFVSFLAAWLMPPRPQPSPLCHQLLDLWQPLLLVTAVAAAVACAHALAEAGWAPFSPTLTHLTAAPFTALTGFALSLLLVFRTNASCAQQPCGVWWWSGAVGLRPATGSPPLQHPHLHAVADSRWLDARKTWGLIVNRSRDLTRQARRLETHHLIAAQPQARLGRVNTRASTRVGVPLNPAAMRCPSAFNPPP